MLNQNTLSRYVQLCCSRAFESARLIERSTAGKTLELGCSMASRAPRLGTDVVDPTRNLGSTWRPDHDRMYWNRGVTICKAKLDR